MVSLNEATLILPKQKRRRADSSRDLEPRLAAVLAGIASGWSFGGTLERLGVAQGDATRLAKQVMRALGVDTLTQAKQEARRLEVPMAADPAFLLGALDGQWNSPGAVPHPAVVAWADRLSERPVADSYSRPLSDRAATALVALASKMKPAQVASLFDIEMYEVVFMAEQIKAAFGASFLDDAIIRAQIFELPTTSDPRPLLGSLLENWTDPETTAHPAVVEWSERMSTPNKREVLGPRGLALLVALASGLPLGAAADLLAIPMSAAIALSKQIKEVFGSVPLRKAVEAARALDIPTAADPKPLLGRLGEDWLGPGAAPSPEVVAWERAVVGDIARTAAHEPSALSDTQVHLLEAAAQQQRPGHRRVWLLPDRDQPTVRKALQALGAPTLEEGIDRAREQGLLTLLSARIASLLIALATESNLSAAAHKQHLGIHRARQLMAKARNVLDVEDDEGALRRAQELGMPTEPSPSQAAIDRWVQELRTRI